MAQADVYTTMFCPYCVRALKLLKQKGVQVREIHAGGDMALRQEMTQRSNGGYTFPQIFIGDMHVGGCDELYALEHAGKLDPLIAQAKG